MRARAILPGAIIAQGCLFASAVVVSQSREPLDPSEVAREAPATVAALATEAPAGFDLNNNGVVDAVRFAAALEEFTGPKASRTASARCSTGSGVANATRRRSSAGRARSWSGGPAAGTDAGFAEHTGGSLIQDRSLYPTLQEPILPGNNVIALRASLSILGVGFVEAIDSNTIAAIAQSQPLSVRCQVIQVPVLEVGGATRVDR
jgi:hypothetical protein